MRLSETARLVWINLVQNKTKVLLTSVGIIVGSATIMLVVAIGTGGKEEVAEQFKNLNAGAIDVTYDSSASEETMMGDMPGGGGGMMGGAPSGGGSSSGGGGFPGGGPGGMGGSNSNNKDKVTLSDSDIEDIEAFVPGITDGTLSFSTTSDVDGGELDDTTTFTIAGIESNYADMSNFTMAIGDFITDENNELKEKECVLGYDAAKTIFGSVYDAYDETVYIDSRSYTVSGVLSQMGTVASGISPDSAIFIEASCTSVGKK